MDTQELERVRQLASVAIQPLKPASISRRSAEEFTFSATRSNAGRDLPPYYSVYFLLVDLLRFTNLGRWEKTAWSIPVEFEGTIFLIEHRKFGVGVFGVDINEEKARRVVKLVKRGVDAAKVFFEWLAADAVDRSALNVENNCDWLFARYRYFYELFGQVSAETEATQQDLQSNRAGAQQPEAQILSNVASYSLRLELSRKANWLGLAAIDAFFSWTEHLFVHLAIVQSRVTTGKEVVDLVEEKAKSSGICDLGYRAFRGSIVSLPPEAFRKREPVHLRRAITGKIGSPVTIRQPQG
jgi:hypothetical protein